MSIDMVDRAILVALSMISGASIWHIVYQGIRERRKSKSTAWLNQVEGYRA